MAPDAQQIFDRRVARYRRARSGVELASDERSHDRKIARLDVAIDLLLAAVSLSAADVGTKLEVLQSEYGVDVQARHIESLYRDIPVLKR